MMKTHNVALINGKHVALSGQRIQTLTNPFTGEEEQRTFHGNSTDVDRAVMASQAALIQWSDTTAEQRSAVLEAIASKIEERSAHIAAAITSEVGTPEKISQIVQVGLPVRVLRGFSAETAQALAPETIEHSTVIHRPLGVVAAITPWNYPLHQAMAKIGAALSAGCTIVLKPSELTPRTTALLMEILCETTPPGVVNVVPGDSKTAADLISHAGIDAVSFTGSVEGGRSVAQAAAAMLKPCFLELGGKSAGIVLDDADIETSLKAIVNTGLLNTGQTCNALTRILVPEAMIDEAAKQVGALAHRMTSRLGPLISKAQYDRVQGFIKRAQEDTMVDLVTGGPGHPEGMEAGYFVKPTVFVARNPNAEIAQSEIFGPVLTLQGYSSDDDLIALANATDYGIAAAIWGKNPDRINSIVQHLRAGQIDVNGAAFNPRAPFGGFRNSGSSREMGLYGIREFQRPVSIQK